MRRIFIGILAATILVSNNSISVAAQKTTLAEYATKDSRCTEPGKYSFSKSGPLICDKRIWKLVKVNADTVATKAYRSLITRYNAGTTQTPNLILRIDPKAGNWKNKIVQGFNAGAKLWGTSSSEDDALSLYVSENAEYISENLALDGIRENPEDAQRNKDAALKGNSQAGSHGTYFDFIFSDQNSHDKGFYQVGPHEYTHFAQRKFSNARAHQIPREFWLEEGCASWVGTSMGGVIGLPQNQREQVLSSLNRQNNSNKLTDFSRGTPEAYSNPNFGNVYDIGSIACEAVVAVAGIDSLEAIYTQVGIEGETFDSASPKVFKMSLDSLISLAQRYLNSVIAQKPLTLSELNKFYKQLQVD